MTDRRTRHDPVGVEGSCPNAGSSGAMLLVIGTIVAAGFVSDRLDQYTLLASQRHLPRRVRPCRVSTATPSRPASPAAWRPRSC